MDHSRGNDHREGRPQGNGQRAQADRRHRQRSNQPRRAHCVNQRAGGHLRRQGHQAAGGENQTDIELRPVMGGEIDCHERAEAGLDIRQEECEPVESARAAWRCRRMRVAGGQINPTAAADQRRAQRPDEPPGCSSDIVDRSISPAPPGSCGVRYWPDAPCIGRPCVPIPVLESRPMVEASE